MWNLNYLLCLARCSLQAYKYLLSAWCVIHVCLSRDSGDAGNPPCWRGLFAPRRARPPPLSSRHPPAAVVDVPLRCILSAPRRSCRRPRQDQRLLLPCLPQHHLLPSDAHRHHWQEVPSPLLRLPQWHGRSSFHSKYRRCRPRSAQERVTTAR